MYYLLWMLLYKHHTTHLWHTHFTHDPHTHRNYTTFHKSIPHTLWSEQTTYTSQQLSNNTILPMHLTQSLTCTPQQIHSSGTPTTNIWRAGWHSLSTSGKAPTNQRPVFIPHPTTFHTILYNVTTNNTTTKYILCSTTLYESLYPEEAAMRCVEIKINI